MRKDQKKKPAGFDSRVESREAPSKHEVHPREGHKWQIVEKVRSLPKALDSVEIKCEEQENEGN